MAGKKKSKKGENAVRVREPSYTPLQLENALNALRENPKRGIRLTGTGFNLKKEKAGIKVKSQ